MFGVIHSTETESGYGSYLNRHLESSANREGHNGFEGVVGPSQASCEVPDRILTVARTDSTVLIEGERGAGKGRHCNSRPSNRRNRPFVTVNRATIPPGAKVSYSAAKKTPLRALSRRN
jgi:transcriptional regulator with GAF, ATPase, and Fis domain